ncbi:MAG: proline dehydrogenase family protein, partial [Bacteroidota bacterium]
ETLEKIQANQALTEEEEESYQNLLKRLSFIGQAAEEKSVCLFVDAEESWIQDVIDKLVDNMMQQHNKNKAIVFNTFQMYRHDRLNFLHESYERSRKYQYILGAKLVRGAYMEKERARASAMNYPSPIQKDKTATDRDFNLALAFCIEHYQHIASYNASHNQESNALQADLILEKGLDRKHPHLNFCQLYGMSDQITFNLGASGFNAMKYVPYGQIKEVIPYLIRRAQENTSVKGEMGREYEFILDEQHRRKKIGKK